MTGAKSLKDEGQTIDHAAQLRARIISGSVGSIITSLAVTPLDVVKVRMQVGTAAADLSSSRLTPSATSSITTTTAATGHAVTAATRNPVKCPLGCGIFVVFNGHMDCVLAKSSVSYFDAQGQVVRPSPAQQQGTFRLIRHIFRTEGWRGLYAGLQPTLVMAVPNTVLYFSAYDELMHQFRMDDNSTSRMAPLAAGGTARFLASSVTAPLEALRTRQAVSTSTSTSSLSLWYEFQYVRQTEGLSSLYRGWRPTMWRDVPFSAIYWYCLEELKRVWQVRVFRHEPPTPAQQAAMAFVNGALAGMVAAACTTPFDVLKTRLQTSSVTQTTRTTAVATACTHNGGVAVELPPQQSTLAGLRHIARTEGVAALWAGNQARMLKVAPACAIMISTYEFGKLLLLPDGS